MTELMLKLRRSPRTLLTRDGHPGPGPGRLALVMARAGVGKTAFLVGIGLDALLSGQRVLHVTLERPVDKVRDWYDDVLAEMLRREKKLAHFPAVQVQLERRRHIHTFVRGSFSVERLRQCLGVLVEAMEFTPEVIILDRVQFSELDRAELEGLRAVAAELGAELWMACRTSREGGPGGEGHLPPPADRFEELVDLAFRLDPHEARVRLHVLKDHEKMLDKDLSVLLDPQTMLLQSGVPVRR